LAKQRRACAITSTSHCTYINTLALWMNVPITLPNRLSGSRSSLSKLRFLYRYETK
jgi:hypothetical protein